MKRRLLEKITSALLDEAGTKGEKSAIVFDDNGNALIVVGAAEIDPDGALEDCMALVAKRHKSNEEA